MFRKLLRYGQITGAANPGDSFAIQQTTYLKKVADTLVVFPYGMHGNAPAGSLALLMSIQGNPDNRAAIAWNPKEKPPLEEGEVAFYHPPTGGTVIWRNNGNLEIVTDADVTVSCANLSAEATAGATVTAPTITLVGNVVVQGGLTVAGGAAASFTGDVNFGGAMTHGGKDVSSTHGHVQGNDSGGSIEQAINGVT